VVEFSKVKYNIIEAKYNFKSKLKWLLIFLFVVYATTSTVFLGRMFRAIRIQFKEMKTKKFLHSNNLKSFCGLET
jgi:hypothetical protein